MLSLFRGEVIARCHLWFFFVIHKHGLLLERQTTYYTCCAKSKVSAFSFFWIYWHPFGFSFAPSTWMCNFWCGRLLFPLALLHVWTLEFRFFKAYPGCIIRLRIYTFIRGTSLREIEINAKSHGVGWKKRKFEGRRDTWITQKINLAELLEEEWKGHFKPDKDENLRGSDHQPWFEIDIIQKGKVEENCERISRWRYFELHDVDSKKGSDVMKGWRLMKNSKFQTAANQ